ncbi:kinase-like domain-containing protein [Rhizophagus clarus]|uniref:Kinase-like domain-containing protein n=1 Tax=Rhizophagus clarus TaxID=94130 RepID=A0A8H3QQ97_9GLOM|nr:kinase-like domain-containing protein [Rhizophagus clarus]
MMIGDLGLCRPLNKVNNEINIIGIMPYIAPEVIRGLGSTKTPDIYIVLELLCGKSLRENHLAFKILDGLRPTILKTRLTIIEIQYKNIGARIQRNVLHSFERSH